MYVIVNNEKTYELYHYGVLGQKWGIRRYQNKDGSLTKAGMKRYYNKNLRSADKLDKDAKDLKKHGYHKEAKAVQKRADKQRAKGKAKMEKKIAKDYNKMSKRALRSKMRDVRKNERYKKTMRDMMDTKKQMRRRFAGMAAGYALASYEVGLPIIPGTSAPSLREVINGIRGSRSRARYSNPKKTRGVKFTDEFGNRVRSGKFRPGTVIDM